MGPLFQLAGEALAPYRFWLIVGGIVAGIGSASYVLWSLADTVGDARELNVIRREAEQRKASADAEVEARNLVRECHSRGTGSDWLWDARLKTCTFQPVRTDRR